MSKSFMLFNTVRHVKVPCQYPTHSDVNVSHRLYQQPWHAVSYEMSWTCANHIISPKAAEQNPPVPPCCSWTVHQGSWSLELQFLKFMDKVLDKLALVWGLW